MNERVASLVARGDPRTTEGWASRLRHDRADVVARQTSDQRSITATLKRRAQASGCAGFALTGSTSRSARTEISDLDYHVIGSRPETLDLPADIDVYVASVERSWSKLEAGDDFIQWTLRCGHVLFDAGIFREIAAAVVERDLWPDGAAKLRRLPELVSLAARLIEMEDRDAAQDQVCATLTSAARGVLLLHDVFPLARAELPPQLAGIGLGSLGDALWRTIFGTPTLTELVECLVTVEESTARTS